MVPLLPFSAKWQWIAAVFFLLCTVGSISVLPAVSSSLDALTPDPTSSVYLPILMQNSASAPPPNSFELIDLALQKGQIDAETALEYKVFAVFDDPRLPAGYRADEVSPDADLFMYEVVAAYPTLSAAAKAVVEPFFIPPFQTGSWEGLAMGELSPTAPGDWTYITAAGGKARVWYKQGDANLQRAAGVIATALNNDIWAKEVALMGREPVYDGAGVQNFVVSNRRRTGGWNGSFIPWANNIAGVNVPQTCGLTGSIIYINPNLADIGSPSTAGLKDTTAHELMHALQHAYPWAVDPCHEYHWMGEATATWVEGFIYPNDDTEWLMAMRYLNTPELGYLNRDNGRDYGEYLLVYWYTHKFEDNDAVRRAWVAAGTMDSLKSFMVFGNLNYMQLVALWNRPPYDTFFLDADGFYNWVRSEYYYWLKAANGFQEYDLWDQLLPGGARYYHFKVDSSVHTITFLNGLTSKLISGSSIPGAVDFTYNQENITPDEQRGADVVTIILFEGVAQPYVLPDPSRWDICQDWLRQKVSEIVVIVANNDTDDRNRVLQSTGKPSRLLVSATPCMKLTGTATRTDTGNGSVKEVMKASGLEFNYVGYDALTDADRYNSFLIGDIPMRLVKGSVAWEISGTDINGCTHTGSQTLTIGQLNSSALNLQFQLLPGSMHYMGYAGWSVPDDGAYVTDTRQCPNQNPEDLIYPPGDFFMGDGLIPVNADGSVSGSKTMDRGSGVTTTYDWNLQPATLP